jgi:cold shock CspA family protein
MNHGTIRMLKTQNGWGFIKSDDASQPDCFFHVSGLGNGVMFDTLSVGMKVCYETKLTDRGPNAVNITTTGDQP